MSNRLVIFTTLVFFLSMAGCDGGDGNNIAADQSGGAVNTPVLWKSVAVGYVHNCGVKTDGTLWCWGANEHGNLGIGTVSQGCGDSNWYCNDKDVPTRVGKDTDWDIIGNGATCAIKKDGTLWCWGINRRGYVGNGTYGENCVSSPVKVIGDGTWNMVSSSSGACGIKNDGTMWCWGYKEEESPSVEPIAIPTQVGIDTDWVYVNVEGGRVTGIKNNGSVWWWIIGGSPKQGDGDDWMIASMYDENSITGLKKDGTMWVKWYESLTDTVKFEQAGTYKWKMFDVETSNYFILCAVRTDFTLWCEGKNDYGQLGIGTSNLQSCPNVNGSMSMGYCEDKADLTQVGSEANWSFIATGAYRSCAIKTDGTLWCWGENQYGALGIGESGLQCMTDEKIPGPGHCADKTTPAQVVEGK